MSVQIPGIKDDCVAVYYDDGVEDDGSDGTIQVEKWDNMSEFDTSQPVILVSVFKRSGGDPCGSPSARGDLHFNSNAEVVSLKRRASDGEMIERWTAEPGGASPAIAKQNLCRANEITNLDLNTRHAAHSPQDVMFYMVDDTCKIETAQDRTDVPGCLCP